MANSSKQPDRRGMMQKLFDRLTLSWRLMVDRRVGITNKFIPPLAILYLLSPIDFVPDIFLPFGIVDDVGVVILALEFFIRTAPSAVVREHLRELQARVIRDNDYEMGDVVEGEYEVRE